MDVNQRVIIDIQTKADTALDQLAQLNRRTDELKTKQKEITETFGKSSKEYQANALELKSVGKEYKNLQNKVAGLNQEIKGENLNTLEQMRVKFSNMQNELKGLDVGSQEFKQLTQSAGLLNTEIKVLEANFGSFQRDVGNYEKGSVSLRQELKNLKQELTAMAMAGKDGSQEFQTMQKRMAGIQDTMADVQQGSKILGDFGGTTQFLSQQMSNFNSSLTSMALIFDDDIQKSETFQNVLKTLNIVTITLQTSTMLWTIWEQRKALAMVASKAVAIALTAKTWLQFAAQQALNAASGNWVALAAGVAAATIGVGTAMASTTRGTEDYERAVTSQNRALRLTAAELDDLAGKYRTLFDYQFKGMSQTDQLNELNRANAQRITLLKKYNESIKAGKREDAARYGSEVKEIEKVIIKWREYLQVQTFLPSQQQRQVQILNQAARATGELNVLTEQTLSLEKKKTEQRAKTKQDTIPEADIDYQKQVYSQALTESAAYLEKKRQQLIEFQAKFRELSAKINVEEEQVEGGEAGTIWNEAIEEAYQKRIEAQREISNTTRENYLAEREAQAQGVKAGLEITSAGLNAINELISEDNEFKKATAIATASLNIAVAISSALKDGLIGLAEIPAIIAAGAALMVSIKSAVMPKKETGGMITGNRHYNGGVAIEAEGGEFIVRREAVKGNEAILRAINNGRGVAPQQVTLYISDIVGGINRYNSKVKII